MEMGIILTQNENLSVNIINSKPRLHTTISSRSQTIHSTYSPYKWFWK